MTSYGARRASFSTARRRRFASSGQSRANVSATSDKRLVASSLGMTHAKYLDTALKHSAPSRLDHAMTFEYSWRALKGRGVGAALSGAGLGAVFVLFSVVVLAEESQIVEIGAAVARWAPGPEVVGLAALGRLVAAGRLAVPVA